MAWHKLIYSKHSLNNKLKLSRLKKIKVVNLSEEEIV
jgi:hypothetical protein